MTIQSDEYWKKELSQEVYHIMREKGTEPAFSGQYNQHYKPGEYRCAACGTQLFLSKDKYDSHSGWPSFTAPSRDDGICEVVDDSLGMQRIEVICSQCKGHLGHVFPDGPTPGGSRYCINSAALMFKEDDHSKTG